jgi:predicted transcriptional regulator
VEDLESDTVGVSVLDGMVVTVDDIDEVREAVRESDADRLTLAEVVRDCDGEGVGGSAHHNAYTFLSSEPT